MYIIALNSAERFYFISREEQRQKLEEQGLEVLKSNYDRLSLAAGIVRDLNQQLEKEKYTRRLSS